MGFSNEIGFLGFGKMAKALAAGINKNNIFKYSDICAYDRNQADLDHNATTLGIKKAANALELIKNSKIVILAVKPQNVKQALADALNAFNNEQLIISIATGWSIKQLKELVGTQTTVIRAMPNTPALIGLGVSAISYEKSAQRNLVDIAKKLFEAVGTCYEAEEEDLAAIAALSGSGPAYFFTFMEAICDAGIMLGLNPDLARHLASETARGAAELSIVSKDSNYAALRAMVSSPGGTTVEASYVMEQEGLRGTIMKAIKAAAEKAITMEKNN